jgi:hypothetical protein
VLKIPTLLISADAILDSETCLPQFRNAAKPISIGLLGTPLGSLPQNQTLVSPGEVELKIFERVMRPLVDV